MCNRFWQYADQVAWAMKHGGKVVSLFWDPSLDDFDNLRNNPHICFPFYSKILRNGKVGNYYRRILNKLLNNDTVQRRFASPFFQKMGFVAGKDIMFKDEYYPEVWNKERMFFTPADSIVKRVDECFESFRHDVPSKIVGVHIRKGDYKSYLGGKYYYDDQEYTDFMWQMIQLLGDDTRFFIASNERVNMEHFARFHIIDIHNTKAAEDMYALSKCDYVMGPFSTFSGWASLYGEVPCLFFRRGCEVKLSDFQIVRKMSFASALATEEHYACPLNQNVQ